ncbi:hypothetical protein VNO78_20885 [Psophocarpus tetragonolobus]|uniref:Peptidase S59 domain-containing protein n=1 Tax=Psophocarpus tetragonolobus TaxID=3891 RepID=A0AAN9SB79_PSOTE
MAETSALCFSTFRFSFAPSLSPSKNFTNSFLFPPSPSPSSSSPHPCLLHFVPKAIPSGNLSGDDSFFFPWSNSDNEIQWFPEERITLFTADGLIQIGGSMVPRRVSSLDKKQGKSKTAKNSQRFHESDYMDPNQGLCLGALFDIAATNGLDMGRRLCIFGFCRSIEMLSDVVEDTVLEHGGEVIAAEKASKGDLQEKLTMTVAVPLLWGVPPASETLHLAVKSGGGIVEKVYWQWDFLLGYGYVGYLNETGVRGLYINKIVKFHRHEIVVYNDENDKPAIGQDLNKAAEVVLVLDNELLKSKEGKEDAIVRKLKQITKRQQAQFVSFNIVTGEWKFLVEHFSRFGFGEDDKQVMDDVEVYDVEKEMASSTNEVWFCWG